MPINIKKTLQEIPPFKRVVVGISGGPDSVALAYLLKNIGYQVILAHLNHSLRGKESDHEQVFVENLAQEWGLPLICSKLNMPKEGNLENQCRQIRYQFLEEVRQKYKAKYIAVGHHQNDQIETIVMHLQRGAGARGRQGMHAVKNHIIRPLLDTPKSSILAFLKQNNLSYCIDSSNQDARFKRNEIRLRTIPRLERQWRNFQANLLKLSEISKKRVKKNEKLARAWMTKSITDQGFDRQSFLSLPDNVQSEVLFQILGHQNVYRKGIDSIKRLISAGKTGKKKTLKEITFQIVYDQIQFYSADKKQESLKKTPVQQKTSWGYWNLFYKGSQSIYVRTWKPGDRFQPNGMQGSKKLQDFFVDAKIPQSQRKKLPIIVNEKDEILSIADMRLSKKGVKIKGDLKLTKIKKSVKIK